MADQNGQENNSGGRLIDRRVFLKRGGLVVGGLLAPTVLAACSDDDATTTTAGVTTTVDGVTTTVDGVTTTAAPDETTTTATTVSAPERFENIQLAQVGPWITLDPNKSTGGAFASGQHLMEGLLQKLPDRSLVPALAAELPTKLDDTTWQVKVRTDRTFTDGTPITAEDIAFSYNRHKDPDFASPWADYIGFITTVDVIDAETVQINMSQPVADDVLLMRLAGIKTVPQAAVKAVGGDAYSINPVPSSGSMMVDAPFDTAINQFKRYEGYEGPRPIAAETVTWQYIPEVQARLAQTEAGQLHIFDGVPPQLYQTIRDSSNVELGLAPVEDTSFVEVLMINSGRAPWDDQRVRQALNYGINVPQLIEIGLLGNGTVARSPLPSTADRYIAPTQQYDYDPDRSKALLTEAGVAMPLAFELLVASWDYVAPQAPILVEQLAAAGFAAEPKVVPIDSYFAEIFAGNYETFVFTIGFEVFGFEPDILFRGWWGPFFAENAMFWTTDGAKRVPQLLDQALEEPDFDKQNLLYAEANEIIVTEAATTPLLFQPLAHAWNKSVAGYQMPLTLGMTLFGVEPSGQ